MQGLRNRSSLWLQEVRSRLRVRGAEQRLRSSRVQVAIERIVDQANPALLGLGGYRRKLFPVVERLLEYADELLARIPGPTELDPATWSSDPLMNALFGDIGRIRQVVSGPPVRAWLEAHPFADGEDLYALLAVMPEERHQLGMELVGDHVQRDVKQTTLSFRDHELFGVADSIDEARRALVQPAVDLMVSIAIGEIVAQEERIAALEQALRMLKLKLKVVNPRAAGLDLVLQGSGQHLAEQERLRVCVEETERDLADASRGLGNIEQYLERLVQLLSHPEKDVALETMEVRLDRMNIVRDRYDPEAQLIRLVRARRADRPGRVAQFIRFPRRLVLSADERLSAVERHLGM